MNGQQLTNSSSSANGTPSSSYPASLSSQSSRDPSPATRVTRKPFTESYNHVISAQPNHQQQNWCKDKGSSDTQPVRHPYIPVPSLTPPLLQSQRESQDVQTTGRTGAPPNQSRPFPPLAPSSQPVYRFPPPTSLPQPPAPSAVDQATPLINHLPQPNSSPSQFPVSVRPPQPTTQITQQSTQISQPPTQITQPPDPPRSTQSPLQQTSNQFQAQPMFQPSSNNQFSPHSNQFQKSVPVQLQQQPIQFQVMPGGQVSQASYQLSQPPKQISQTPSQITPLQNKFPQSPNQISQFPNIPQPHNKFPQPPNTMSLPQNKISQPQNKFSQPPNQMPHPPNIIQESQKLSQPVNQVSQPLNLIPPINQFSKPPSQMSQPQGQFSQPPNHFSQSSGQCPPQAPIPQSQYMPGTGLISQPGLSYPQQPPPAQQLPNHFNKRYPQMQQSGYQQQQGSVDGLTPQLAGMTVQQGFNKLWGMDTVDLLKCRDLLPKEKLEPPPVRLQHELYEAANCSPEIFRCTLTKIPETKSLLDKSRLPLGVLIHPFKDLNQLSVIQCTVIVRCRMCRTYINPFVYFVDNKRWKCNLCFRVNELPDEFQFDPMTKTYGDPSRRPEIKSATIEFIAPSEYMVRPPQPAIYVFVLDVSRLACECGYLDAVCRTLLAELDNVPGDARTSVAFITFDSAVHFYSLTEGQGQPHQMIVVDIDDMFLPTPDNLLVSLNECRDLIRDLLQELPNKYKESYDTHSALGAALQAAYKMLAPTGGRVTVFQSCLPNVGPGALTAREDPAQRAGDNPPHLNPSTDFYKKLALDCSGQQIAVDLFLVNSQYLDLATLSGVSRFSGGCMHHIPLYRSDKPLLVDTLERMFQRYLTRKIGFESVMRLRCTRGLSIHTFHGNFFVRSTDLLSLPNANPDAGFGMQVTIDENLSEVQNVCFQAALLYTSSKGERRIRVHTLCLPVVSNLADVLHGADQQCIVGLLAKMAVDRAIQSSLSDAREAFVNVVGDILSAYRLTQSGNTAGCMLAPGSLRLLPLYVLALLKHVAFRVGQSTRLDDRVFAMCQMKSLPLTFIMQSVYPDLYPLLKIEQQPQVEVGDILVPQPPRLQLSAERVDSLGLFLLDDGASLLVYVGHNLDPAVCQAVFNVPHFSAIPQELYMLPELDNSTSKALRSFITYLQNEKPYPTPLQVVRDDSHHRMRFLERLIEDKNESGTSYYEFLQRVKSLIK